MAGSNPAVRLRLALAGAVVAAAPLSAQEPQEAPPPSLYEELLRTIESMQHRIDLLEQERGAPAPQAVREGAERPVRDRGGLYDRQSAAPRLGGLTLDPEYRGFFPVLGTSVLMRINAKPRLDATFDNRDTGNDFRFVPGGIPPDGTTAAGSGRRFNLNANGTQFSVDVRAPDDPGNFRFYYQHDFFGSDDANMRYRLQHAYGQYHDVTAGFTFSAWEDPDIWPDTVDYEGPSSVIFARRPVIHYRMRVAEQWTATVGVEDPDFFLDTTFDTTVSMVPRMPDIAANLRWEDPDAGHSQISTIFRRIGVSGDTVGTQTEFAWGLNASLGLDLGDGDSLQVLLVGGEGIAGMGNDTSFFESDGAFSASGELEALPYYSGMLGYTHAWSPGWRSTAVVGQATVDNSSGQPASAFHESLYTSVNLIRRMGPRFSIGTELLYGWNERADGQDGDAFRFQVGLVYSLF